MTNSQVLALGVAANGDAALVLAGATAVRESARGTFGPVQELYAGRDVDLPGPGRAGPGERPARVAVRYAGDARFAPAQRTVKVRSAG